MIHDLDLAGKAADDHVYSLWIENLIPLVESEIGALQQATGQTRLLSAISKSSGTT